VFVALSSNSAAALNFCIRRAVANDFIVGGVVENLSVFFSLKYITFGVSSPKELATRGEFVGGE